jgi:hypothetical protein
MADGKEVQVPIACSLTAAELVDRGAAWSKLLGTSLVASERVAGGLRVTVHPVALPSLRALVKLERDCCPWINFRFDDDSLVMTAPGDGEEALLQMFSPD